MYRIIVVLYFVLVCTQVSAASIRGELVDFGLVATWSMDCSKDVQTQPGFSSTFSAPVSGPASYTYARRAADNHTTSFKYEIESVIRLTDEKLRLTMNPLELKVDGAEKPLEGRSAARLLLTVEKQGARIRTSDARSADGSFVSIRDGKFESGAAAPAMENCSMPARVATPAAPSAPSLAEVQQLLAQNKYADAITHLDTVLMANPYNETALRLRVAASLSLSHFPEARADIDTLLKTKPKDSGLLVQRSCASIGMHQLVQATADANEALAVDPNNAAAYVCRGVASRMSGKLQDAIVDQSRAISLNNKDYMPFFERGQVYAVLGQFDKALLDLDRALLLNPLSGETRELRRLTLQQRLMQQREESKK